MTTKKQKTLLILIGLTVTLLLIESIARCAGFVYKNYRISNAKVKIGLDKDAVKILCLGDSFTFGLGAERGDDYPSQLERLLNKNYPNKKFNVYNRGVPGYNSSIVLKNLTNNISVFKPDIIILLVGSNDTTTLEDSDYYLFKSFGISKINSFFLRLDMALCKLKIYKIAKILILNLKNKSSFGVGLPERDEQKELDYLKRKSNDSFVKSQSNEKKEIYLKKAEALCSDRKYSQAEKILAEMPGGFKPENRREYLFLARIYYEQEKYDLAIGVLTAYLKDGLQDAEAILDLGKNYYFQGEVSPAIKKENFQRALALFNRALSCVKQDDPGLKVEIYQHLFRVYWDMGDNVLAKQAIENSLKIRPRDKYSRQLRNMLADSSRSEEEKEVFKRLLFYNFGKIINICRIYNIKIILLDYPSEFKGSVRKEIADAYRVPFIDIGSKFEKAGAGNKERDLLSSDRNHPNAGGYKIMAEAVFEDLNLERMGAWQ